MKTKQQLKESIARYQKMIEKVRSLGKEVRKEKEKPPSGD